MAAHNVGAHHHHAVPASFVHTQQIALNSAWELAGATPGQITQPTQLDTHPLTWYPATVPGTAAQALQHAGVWNLTHQQPNFDTSDWWYRCHFSWPHEQTHGPAAHHTPESIVLCLDGLATIADVWLNDVHILHAENMYTAHEINIGALLQEHNTLHIRFASLTTVLAVRRPRPAWRTRLTDQQQLRWFRTTLLGRMPGWSPSPQTAGPWQPVRIEKRHTFELLDTRIHTHVEDTTGVVDVQLRVHAIDETTHIRTATLVVGESTIELTSVRDNADIILTGTLRIDTVQLWWPHTHGAQPRYPATITVAYDHADAQQHTSIDCGQLAFRTIALDTTNGNFAFHINSVPVFCRGACWSTIDSVTLRGSVEQYRAALTLARDAGMNMLRIGGTMVYESDTFYELCDTLGILVWHDFMFANMDYPFNDEHFAATVRDEVTQLLTRTQTRACIAVWCGNSEIEQQTAMLGLPRERWSHPFFQDTLPTLCQEVRPDVPYWPSSPSGGTLPFQVNAGDAHYFGYGPYLREFDDVLTSNVRFASEALAFAHIPELATIDLVPGGASGAGHHPGWKAGVPRDNGSGWDFEDIRDIYVEKFFHVSPVELRYSDTDRYLALGRIASSEAISRAVAEWRRPSSTCHGALIWFYRDLRPGAGWGLVDATGRPKAAYYAMRRASQPTTVFIADQRLNGLYLTLLNDTAHTVTADLNVTLYRHGEFALATADRQLTLAPHSAEELHADSLFDGFRDLSYAYRFGPPNHDLIVATLTDHFSGERISDAFFFPLGLPTTQHTTVELTAEAISVDNGGYQLRLQSHRFAQSVAIDVEHFRPDDNYFHLAPGTVRIVRLHPLRTPYIEPGITMPPHLGDNLVNRRPVSGIVTPLNAATATRIIVR